MSEEPVPDEIVLVKCPTCGGGERRTTQDLETTRLRVGGINCRYCGGLYFMDAIVDRYDPQRVSQDAHSHIDMLVDAMHQLAGEADELVARDDVDDHLQHIIEGLRFQARDVQEWLNEHYYDDRVELIDPDYDGEDEPAEWPGDE